MENKFRKGLILGGLLALGAAMGLAMSSAGQELTEELQKDLKALAKRLKKDLNKLEDITQEGFDELATTVVEEYAKTKELASGEKEALVSALQAKWREMEAEYLDEK